MNYIVNKLRSMYKTSIVLSIILIFIGIFLLIQPETTLYAISYFVGIVLIVWGLFPIISFLTNKESQKFLELSFVTGIIAFLFGVVVMIKPDMIGSIIPLLLGLWMVINGAIKLYYSFILNKEGKATLSIIVSLLILLGGILLVINPFEGAVVLTKIIGISFITYSILDLLECFSIFKTYKSIKKETESNDNNIKIIDGEVEEKENRKNK